jgi:hypothetical protein
MEEHLVPVSSGLLAVMLSLRWDEWMHNVGDHLGFWIFGEEHN